MKDMMMMMMVMVLMMMMMMAAYNNEAPQVSTQEFVTYQWNKILTL